MGALVLGGSSQCNQPILKLGRVLAAWLRVSRGMLRVAAQIIITAGTQH